MLKKRIVVACGTGIATSTVAADRISKECEKAGIDVDIIQCKVSEINSYLADADLIVSTTILPVKTDVPVVNGLPFITGIGIEKAVESIVKELTC